MSPTAALLLTSGSVTVAMATPNTPSGSCISRNALLSHETAPLPWSLAKEAFTATLTCTALAAMTAGPIRRRMVRTPASSQRRSK